MFTGIVTDLGKLTEITGDSEKGLVVQAKSMANSAEVGSSIACAGICLTVIGTGTNWFEVFASKETLEKTTIAEWDVGGTINLERALRAGEELGGHFVTGHVDGTVPVRHLWSAGNSLELQLALNPWLGPFITEKASVTIDGVSLTVNDVTETAFSINVIPHTQKVTTLGKLTAGKMVNVEVDVFARYVTAALATKKV